MDKERQDRVSLTFITFLFSLFICFSACEQITDPVHTHQWGEWTQTTAPACATAGEDTRVCRLNKNHIETRAVPPIGHEWGEWTQTRAPTQTLDGEETRTCIHNSEHTEIRVGAAAFNHIHQWGEWARTAAPTCTSEGKETRICLLNAAHTDTRTTGAALGHEYIYTITTPATCITTGEEVGTCIRDATHTMKRVIPIDPDAHHYQWVIIASSHIEENMEKEICTLCSYESGNTRVLGSSLLISTTEEWNNTLTQLNGRTGSYTLTIGGDFTVDGTAAASFGATASGSLSVTLKGSGILSLSSNGSIVNVGSNQTLIIDGEDLILAGRAGNDAPVVYVSGLNANLELRNGTISGNTTSSYGGGVYVYGGSFTMNGGEISGNTADYGGGVYVSGGSFATNNGVYASDGSFIMNGGEIREASISGNTATYGGGGVYVYGGATFRIITGTIYGSSDGGILRNRVTGSGANGAALYGTSQRGTLNGETWNTKGILSTTNNRIWVDNGELVENIVITQPIWYEGSAVALVAPSIPWLTTTAEGWQISDTGDSDWSELTPPTIADIFYNGKYLRYCATSVSGQTYYSNTVAFLIEIISITAPLWRVDSAVTITAPSITWLTTTAEGWQTSDTGDGGWSELTPPTTGDMFYNGKYLRYYAASVSGVTYYSNTVTIRVLSLLEEAVVIDMYDSTGDGWDRDGALRINVNGVDIATNVKVKNAAADNTPSGQRNTNTYIFIVNKGDVVRFYWVAGTFQQENSFIAYYFDVPPSPAFATSSQGPTSWSGSNALVYRVRSTMSSTTNGELLGQFTVLQ